MNSRAMARIMRGQVAARHGDEDVRGHAARLVQNIDFASPDPSFCVLSSASPLSGTGRLISHRASRFGPIDKAIFCRSYEPTRSTK